MIDYSKFLNKSIANVPPSGIRKFFDLASNMEGVISLGVGEPDFKTPYNVREEAIATIVAGDTQYTSNAGLEALRKEIAFYMEHRFGIRYYYKNEILVTVGASEAIDLALRAIINNGDEVIIPEPSYVSYSPNVIFAGGKPVPLDTFEADSFSIDVDKLEKLINPNTKAIIMPYPNNPTGAVLNEQDLDNIAYIANKHDILIISDEIYAELNYSDTKHLAIASKHDLWDRTITINGFSKAFAMTGWRVGYLCAPKGLCDIMLKIHQYVIMCASTVSQVAAYKALKIGRETDYEDVRAMIESYNQRRRLVLSELRKMGLPCIEPKGAFYIFPSIKNTGLSSDEFCTKLLQSKKVACVPGTAFGKAGEGYIRISYATSIEKLKRALYLISEFIKEIN